MPLSGTLTKTHIIDAVSERNGFTRKKSLETVEILLELIKQSPESGDNVQISGFGKFWVKEQKKRRGRNPATGKAHDAETPEGCQISMLGETEGETEQKESYGKEKSRQETTNSFSSGNDDLMLDAMSVKNLNYRL